MRWLVVVALGGCSFDHGDRSRDAAVVDGIDGPVDVRIDMPPGATCYDQWLDNSIHFGTPIALTAINSTSYDRDPWLPADELSIYWSSQRAATVNNGEVWVATRTSISGTFSTPMLASAFNSTLDETKLSISADNKVAVVGSVRTGSMGVDVWESIRLNVTDQWPAMNRTNLMMVDTAGDEHDPTISANAQHLYLAPNSPTPQHLAMATRAGNGMFGAPVVLTVLNNAGEADPSPTPDERIMVFTSHRPPGDVVNGHIWYSTRASATATWGAPRIVPDVNTTGAEGDAHLSTDGCRLYFARDLGNDNWDIYVAGAN